MTYGYHACAGMDEGTITFLDVLGWKGIWTRHPCTICIEKLRKLVTDAVNAVDGLVSTGAAVFDFMRGFRSKDVRIISVSDTIVIHSVGAPDATLWLNTQLCKLIICESIEEGIPVRGASCYGYFKVSSEGIM